jgi:hypothetical protein
VLELILLRVLTQVPIDELEKCINFIEYTSDSDISEIVGIPSRTITAWKKGKEWQQIFYWILKIIGKEKLKETFTVYKNMK